MLAIAVLCGVSCLVQTILDIEISNLMALHDVYISTNGQLRVGATNCRVSILFFCTFLLENKYGNVTMVQHHQNISFCVKNHLYET